MTQRNVGIAVIALSILLVGYSFYLPSGYGEFINVELMARKQNLLILGCVVLLVGVIFFVKSGTPIQQGYGSDDVPDRFEGEVQEEDCGMVYRIYTDGLFQKLLIYGSTCVGISLFFNLSSKFVDGISSSILFVLFVLFLILSLLIILVGVLRAVFVLARR